MRDSPLKRPRQVSIQDLGQRECRAILRRNHIGRIAFARRSLVNIEPLGYTCVGDWLFGRTSEGAKVADLRHQPWVAFEADEVDGPFTWRSVVVHGTFYLLGPDGTPSDVSTYRRALRAVRRLQPEALRRGDPVAHRTLLFGVYIDAMTGRESTEV